MKNKQLRVLIEEFMNNDSPEIITFNFEGLKVLKSFNEKNLLQNKRRIYLEGLRIALDKNKPYINFYFYLKKYKVIKNYLSLTNANDLFLIQQNPELIKCVEDKPFITVKLFSPEYDFKNYTLLTFEKYEDNKFMLDPFRKHADILLNNIHVDKLKLKYKFLFM